VQNDQSEVIRFIVRALADDYESIETLLGYYKEPQPGMPSFSKAEIIQALTALITRGAVQPYLHSESDQRFVPAKFLPESAESYWFNLTAKGKELLSQLMEED